MDETALFALDEVLLQETQVASSRPQSVALTPAVVSLVEREEILRSGARDLVDVLQLVPGFFFGVDVSNVVGVGFRGNWGHEGKVLLLVDGQEMNEGMYSTLPLGNRFPVDQIQRVEVIRGPGSALYGGNAELAVINVVTRGAEQLQGGAASFSYGQAGSGFMRRNLSLAAGHVSQSVEGLSASVSGTFGQGQRSTRTYADGYGQSFSLDGANRLDPRQLNLGVQYKQLKLRVLYEDFDTTTRDLYDRALAAPMTMGFGSLLAELRHDLPVSEQLTLTTRLNYSRQVPWQNAEPGDAMRYNKRFARYRGRVMLGYAPLEGLHLSGGVDAFVDHAALNDLDLTGFQTLFRDTGTASVQYTSVAAVAEAQLDTEVVNVVAGARLEHHSAVGSSFVPRLALTKQLGDFHAKAMFSRAFRAPGVENLNYGVDVRPEHTTALELEAGYQLREDMALVANVFDITIRDPIVYFYEEGTNVDGYRNFERSGTRGAELEYRVEGAWGRADLRYSLYTAAGKAQPSAYATDRKGSLLGLPNQRVSLSGYAKLPAGFTLAPTLHLFGPRARTDGLDAAGATQYAREPTQLLVHLFLQRQDAFVKGLDLGLGVYNLLGADFRYVQPYDGGHAPLPGQDRELMVRAGYTLPF
nr:MULTISPECIES: TonB-dependent receptor plug domain-containing protein [Myxococcaceae]